MAEYARGAENYMNMRVLGSRDFNVTYGNKRLFVPIDTENLEKGSGELINQLKPEEWKKFTELDGKPDADGVQRFKNQQEVLDYFSSHALMEGYFDEEAGINKQGTLVDIFVNKDNQVMFTLETRDDQGFKKLVPKTMRGTTKDDQVAAFSLEPTEDGRTSFFDLGQLVATGHGAREIKFNQQIGGSLGLSTQIVDSTKYGQSVDEARSMLPPSQGGTGLASGTRLDTQPGTTGTGDSSPADGGTVQDAISDLEDKIVSNEVPVPEAISIYDEKILPAIKNYNANIDKKIEDAKSTESMRTSGGENTDALNIIQNLELDENGIPTKFLNQGEAEILFDAVKDTIVAAPNLPRHRDREPNPFSLKYIENNMRGNNAKWRNGEAALREIEEIENTPLEDIPDRNVGMTHTSKYTKMGGEIYIAAGSNSVTGNKQYKKLSTYKAEQERNVAMGKQGLADNIKAIQGAMGAERQTEINKANRLTQPKNERLERINDILDNEDVKARYTDSAIQDLEKEKATLVGEIMEINNQYISPDEAKRFGIDEKIPEGKDEFMEWAANENNEAKLKALGTDAETVDKAKEYIEKNNIENPEGVAAGPVWDPQVGISRTAVTAAIMGSTGMTGNDYFNNFYKMSNFQATGDQKYSQADVDKFNVQETIKRQKDFNKYLDDQQKAWNKEVDGWNKMYDKLIDDAFFTENPRFSGGQTITTIKDFRAQPQLRKEIKQLTNILDPYMKDAMVNGVIDFDRVPEQVVDSYENVASLVLDSVLQYTPNADGFVGRWRDRFRDNFSTYGAMEQTDHLVAETKVINGQRRLVGFKLVQNGKETKAEIPREVFNQAFGPPGSPIRQIILSMASKDMATLAEEQEDEG